MDAILIWGTNCNWNNCFGFFTSLSFHESPEQTIRRSLGGCTGEDPQDHFGTRLGGRCWRSLEHRGEPELFQGCVIAEHMDNLLKMKLSSFKGNMVRLWSFFPVLRLSFWDQIHQMLTAL